MTTLLTDLQLEILDHVSYLGGCGSSSAVVFQMAKTYIRLPSNLTFLRYAWCQSRGTRLPFHVSTIAYLLQLGTLAISARHGLYGVSGREPVLI
jgi:hypothetical protein